MKEKSCRPTKWLSYHLLSQKSASSELKIRHGPPQPYQSDPEMGDRSLKKSHWKIQILSCTSFVSNSATTNKGKIELNGKDYYQIKSFTMSLNSIIEQDQFPYSRVINWHNTKKKTQYIFVPLNHPTPRSPNNVPARRLTRSMKRSQSQTPNQIKKPTPAHAPSPTPTPVPSPAPLLVSIPSNITPMQLDECFNAIPIHQCNVIQSPVSIISTEEDRSSQSMKVITAPVLQVSSKFN